MVSRLEGLSVSRIFMSHSSRDNREAVALREWLSEQLPELANEIFLDISVHTGLRTGQRWKKAFRKANDRCEAVICQEIEVTGVGPEGFVWPPTCEPDRAPYRAWDRFEVIDAGVFFGRDGAIVLGTDVLRQMRQSGLMSLLVVFGPSGSGKSSFLRAGLIAATASEDRTVQVRVAPPIPSDPARRRFLITRQVRPTLMSSPRRIADHHMCGSRSRFAAVGGFSSASISQQGKIFRNAPARYLR
jgi:hypothetical protein